MFELRWLEYKIKVPPEFNALAPKQIGKKLQYRYQMPGMEDFMPDMRWTEWIDVPTVKET